MTNSKVYQKFFIRSIICEVVTGLLIINMRILFYGNCQLGALAKHIRHNSNEYQILSCNDYGLEKFWVDEGLFAVWSLENQNRTDQYQSKIIEAVQTCDIFIFQHLTDTQSEKLKTENLIKHLSPRSLSICFPSFRYWGYLYQTSMIDYFVKKLAKEKLSPEQILHRTQSETTDYLTDTIEELHVKSVEGTRKREEANKQRYANCITVSEFIEANYDKLLIAYDHCHPSTHVYNYYLDRLEDYGIVIKKKFDNTSILPGSSQLFPKDLFYFNDYFRNIENLDHHSPFFKKRLNLSIIEEQIDELHRS